MVRGTFANIRLKNLMVPGRRGRRHASTCPTGERMAIYDAAERYQRGGHAARRARRQGVRHAARSRDWAAKGTLLLGVRAVIAESYERIHRTNLVGHGRAAAAVQARPERRVARASPGSETLTIRGLAGELRPRQDVTVEVERPDGSRSSLHGHRPPRHAGGDQLLPERRHPADGAAQDAAERRGGPSAAAVPRLIACHGSTDLPRRGADGHRLAVPARGRRASGCSWTPGCSRARRRCACATGRSPSSTRAQVDAIVLTHTHLDHIGRVPRLVKQGFRGPIYCTPPTRELAEVLLLDAAHLQQEDAEYLNRKGLTKHKPALPLFDDDGRGARRCRSSDRAPRPGRRR